MQRYWKEGLVLLVVLALLIALVTAVQPIGQDLRSHRFADQRTLFGIPNALNVLSNTPFLVVGLLGLHHMRRSPFLGAEAAWATHFAGTALICFGSAYFHWAPDDQSLVWDRLPMTVAFMGFFVALLTEHVGQAVESALLVPALLLGVGSVLWWAYAGDLRVYMWVQCGPLLAIPTLILCCKGRFTHRHYLLYGLGCYIVAKFAEILDWHILEISAQWVSGHSLKHLLAAGAPLCLCLMLKRRTTLAP